MLKNDRDFNHSLIVDVMYINNDPTLHVVDEAKYSQAARLLFNISATHTWGTSKLCWIDVYIGTPEVIVHDAGINFESAEFRQSASNLAIKLKCVPIEAP